MLWGIELFQQFSERSMEIVQAKLQQNINKGSMNSFEKLAKTFQSNSYTTPSEVIDKATTNTMMELDDLNEPKSSKASIIPPATVDNKQLVLLNSTYTKKKHSMPFAAGSSGAKLARRIISKRNRRSQVSVGMGIVKKHRLNQSKK